MKQAAWVAEGDVFSFTVEPPLPLSFRGKEPPLDCSLRFPRCSHLGGPPPGYMAPAPLSLLFPLLLCAPCQLGTEGALPRSKRGYQPLLFVPHSQHCCSACPVLALVAASGGHASPLPLTWLSSQSCISLLRLLGAVPAPAARPVPPSRKWPYAYGFQPDP